MKTSPKSERPAPSRRLDNFGRTSSESFPISTLIKSRFFSAPKLWPADEQHVRRPGWTELFYDLVFAAAISQLSAPLEADYSLHGVVRYAFLLALVFLAWLGYTTFSTQFAVDDVLQRVLIVAQVFFVAVMAANATGPLSSRDAAGFGAAYGGVRAVLALQYARVIGLSGTRPVVIRRIVWLVAAAVVWTASALLPAPHRYVAWCLAFSMDIANSWPPSHGRIMLPPGAAHFPERFGLLTIILLGEFVASVMRGIESQMSWSFLAASAAVLSLGLGFAIWSCYSDGAKGWETRHVRSHKDVVRLRGWIALHFPLFRWPNGSACGESSAVAGRDESGGRGQRPRLQRIVCKDAISGFAWIIARQVNSLGREIDCRECLDRFCRRQTLLSALDGALQ